MFVLFQYSLKNALARRLTGALTVAGVALVVFVFSAVLMLANGLQKTLVDTGNEQNIVALRQAATTELVSIITRDMADVIKSDMGVARNADGSPRLAGEFLVLIGMTKKSNGDVVNANVRGVADMSFALRPVIAVTQGTRFRPGTSEIIVGEKVAGNYQGAGLGSQLKFGGREWTIVGVFSAGGSGFESEIWGDYDQLGAAFQRPMYSSLTFQLANGADFTTVKNRLEADRRLTVEIMTEKEYYRKQSESFTIFIRVLGLFIAIVFSLGAVVGAMITMYSAVANRTAEIGTLRALGFGRGSVLVAFLTESLFISIVGGLIGIGLANFLRFLEISTTNFDTFAEIAFSFRISPEIALQALTFSIVMGILGGFLPAVRAARVKIVHALKAR